ncbi:hypothetical protein BJ742DRAFT_573181 [Cladochytrium replicatum]|nr:hypothetical protein BJ742DRAFT_573181 [Cladochytrium replicatum]
MTCFVCNPFLLCAKVFVFFSVSWWVVLSSLFWGCFLMYVFLLFPIKMFLRFCSLLQRYLFCFNTPFTKNTILKPLFHLCLVTFLYLAFVSKLKKFDMQESHCGESGSEPDHLVLATSNAQHSLSRLSTHYKNLWSLSLAFCDAVNPLFLRTSLSQFAALGFLDLSFLTLSPASGSSVPSTPLDYITLQESIREMTVLRLHLFGCTALDTFPKRLEKSSLPRSRSVGVIPHVARGFAIVALPNVFELDGLVVSAEERGAWTEYFVRDPVGVRDERARKMWVAAASTKTMTGRTGKVWTKRAREAIAGMPVDVLMSRETDHIRCRALVDELVEGVRRWGCFGGEEGEAFARDAMTFVNAQGSPTCNMYGAIVRSRIEVVCILMGYCLNPELDKAFVIGVVAEAIRAHKISLSGTEWIWSVRFSPVLWRRQDMLQLIALLIARIEDDLCTEMATLDASELHITPYTMLLLKVALQHLTQTLYLQHANTRLRQTTTSYEKNSIELHSILAKNDQKRKSPDQKQHLPAFDYLLSDSGGKQALDIPDLLKAEFALLFLECIPFFTISSFSDSAFLRSFEQIHSTYRWSVTTLLESVQPFATRRLYKDGPTVLEWTKLDRTSFTPLTDPSTWEQKADNVKVSLSQIMTGPTHTRPKRADVETMELCDALAFAGSKSAVNIAENIKWFLECEVEEHLAGTKEWDPSDGRCWGYAESGEDDHPFSVRDPKLMSMEAYATENRWRLCSGCEAVVRTVHLAHEREILVPENCVQFDN